MFFTQEDYKKIYNWIKLHSIKDSDFPDARPLDGRETVTIIQQGHNVKFLLRDFLEQLFLLNTPDFINVTERYNLGHISLFEAIKAIPYRSRKIGQVITFIDEDGNWRIYQFRGERKNQWNILTLWVDILQDIIDKGNILPDEEDLTAVKEGDRTVVKFKDKPYNPDNFSGKGRVYLRKNITEVIDNSTKVETTKNLLVQSMIGWEDTYYFIQYDYDLNGQTITIPQDSKLIFIGGSINNGTLNCINTTIQQFNGTANLTGNYKLDSFLYTDDEDITKDIDSTLKFADKEYNPANFSGLGKVYLRKNIVEVKQEDGSVIHKNILTQDMINKPNTRYIIQYDFNLNEQEITIPESCILDFQGGSLSNGKLVSDYYNTYIISKTLNIFYSTLKFHGYFKLDKITANYFAAESDELSDKISACLDCIRYMNSAASSYSTIYVINGKYLCKKSIIVRSDIIIDFQNSIIDLINDVPLITTNYSNDNIYGQVFGNITIKNLNINLFGERTEYSIDIINSWKVTYDNIGIKNTKEHSLDSKDGIRVGAVRNVNNSPYVQKIINCHLPFIHMDNGATDSYIVNNEIWANGYNYGLRLTTSVNIIGNQFVGGDKYGAIYSNSLVSGIKIIGNYFDGSYFDIPNPYSIYGVFKDSLFIGNWFWRQKANAIYLKNNSNTDTTNILISNNIFEDNDMLQTGYSDIYSEDQVVVSINNNCFKRRNCFNNKGNIVNRTLKYNIIEIKGHCIVCNNTVVGGSNYNNAIYNEEKQCLINNNLGSVLSDNIIDRTFEKTYFSSGTFLTAKYASFKNNNNQIFTLQPVLHDTNSLFNNPIEGLINIINNQICIYKNNKWINYKGYDINIKYNGTTSERPINVNTGFQYFDTTLNKPIWWNDTQWVNSDGNDADSPMSGSFADRPTGVKVGYSYFCTDKQTTEGSTNGIMIYYKGSNTWVDALGRVVS